MATSTTLAVSAAKNSSNMSLCWKNVFYSSFTGEKFFKSIRKFSFHQKFTWFVTAYFGWAGKHSVLRDHFSFTQICKTCFIVDEKTFWNSSKRRKHTYCTILLSMLKCIFSKAMQKLCAYCFDHRNLKFAYSLSNRKYSQILICGVWNRIKLVNSQHQTDKFCCLFEGELVTATIFSTGFDS